MTTYNLSGLNDLRLSLLNITCLRESIASLTQRVKNKQFASKMAAFRAPKTIKNLEQQLKKAIKKHNEEHPKNAV